VVVDSCTHRRQAQFLVPLGEVLAFLGGEHWDRFFIKPNML
jgi:hypothetical protein